MASSTLQSHRPGSEQGTGVTPTNRCGYYPYSENSRDSNWATSKKHESVHGPQAVLRKVLEPKPSSPSTASVGGNTSETYLMTRKDYSISNSVYSPNDGALLYNIRILSQRGRFPTGRQRLPLSLTNDMAHFIAFNSEALRPKTLYENSNCHRLCMKREPNRVQIVMLCYKREKDHLPIFEIPLTCAEMVARTCSEIGPCLYLSTSIGVFEFQCTRDGRYNYSFWESQMRYFGVKIILPHDLFVASTSQLVGEGSFAKVYPAIHRPSRTSVVIKKVPKEKLSNLPDNHLSAVHIEIDVLRRIYHPFVVNFQTAFEDEFNYYIVLERLAGGNVYEWLRQHRNYTESQARGAMFRILTALAALESKGVVHRDLKLENLVLENPQDPTSIKVIDFGLAAFIGSPRMNMHCGSPGFVAPEIINKKPYGNRVDMFSVGVLLYSILCGKTPFHGEGDTASQTLFKNKQCHLTFDAKLWRGISNDACDLISRLLTKDPESRLSSEQALMHSWMMGKVYSLQLKNSNSLQLLHPSHWRQDIHPSLLLEQNTNERNSSHEHSSNLSIVGKQSRNPLYTFTQGNCRSSSGKSSFQAEVTRLPLLGRHMNYVATTATERDTELYQMLSSAEPFIEQICSTSGNKDTKTGKDVQLLDHRSVMIQPTVTQMQPPQYLDRQSHFRHLVGQESQHAAETELLLQNPDISDEKEIRQCSHESLQNHTENLLRPLIPLEKSKICNDHLITCQKHRRCQNYTDEVGFNKPCVVLQAYKSKTTHSGKLHHGYLNLNKYNFQEQRIITNDLHYAHYLIKNNEQSIVFSNVLFPVDITGTHATQRLSHTMSYPSHPVYNKTSFRNENEQNKMNPQYCDVITSEGHGLFEHLMYCSSVLPQKKQTSHCSYEYHYNSNNDIKNDSSITHLNTDDNNALFFTTHHKKHRVCSSMFEEKHQSFLLSHLHFPTKPCNVSYSPVISHLGVETNHQDFYGPLYDIPQHTREEIYRNVSQDTIQTCPSTVLQDTERTFNLPKSNHSHYQPDRLIFRQDPQLD